MQRSYIKEKSEEIGRAEKTASEQMSLEYQMTVKNLAKIALSVT
jgi:hypothetical protein